MITVLYEDHRTGQGKFLFHQFLLCAACDHLPPGTPFWQLEQGFDALPCNGNAKLLQKIAGESDLLLAGGGRLIAILDADQIRQPLRLPASANLAQCRTAIHQRCPQPDRLDTAFLIENIESVLRAIQRCDPALLPDRLQIALNKGREAPLSRDLVFKEASREARRALRDCMLSQMPSLQEIVTLFCQRATEFLSPGDL